jgi:serine/threonine protein kinase
VHGDLKAVNVLIDVGERALLCNFGLADHKADVNVRSTTAETRTLLESPNWMAPELFSGQTLRYPCDVYSFAMTVYEVGFFEHSSISDLAA